MVWISFASMPAAFSPSTTWLMASVFLSSAARAVCPSVVTPVEMSTLSGVVFTAPVAASERVRLSGSSAWALGASKVSVEASRASMGAMNFKEEVREDVRVMRIFRR